jgi:uncharacterized protein YbcI
LLHKRILDFESKLQDLLNAREKEQLDKREYSKRLKIKESELLTSKKESMTREEEILRDLENSDAMLRQMQKTIKEKEIEIKSLSARLEEMESFYS